MSMEAILEVKHLSKAFGKHQVLRDIDFTVRPGDVTSIIGASGSAAVHQSAGDPQRRRDPLPRKGYYRTGRERPRLPDQGGHGVPVL